MKRPSFLEGVAVALAAGVAGSLVYTALTLVAPDLGSLRLVVGAIGLGYVLYLLSRSRQRVGRVTTVAAWLAAAALAWLAQPPLLVYLLAHLGMVWVIRSLYFHASLLSAVADLGLSVLSLAAAAWALVHSGSLFLAIWCLFLVQALFCLIPPGLGPRPRGKPPGRDAGDRFEYAHQAAETALRRLYSIH